MDKTINELIDEAAKGVIVDQYNDPDINYTLIKYKAADGFTTTSLPMAVLVSLNALLYPIIVEKCKKMAPRGVGKETNFVNSYDGVEPK
jgi:hypothetical protein